MTLFNTIQQVLGEHKLSLENIHGQSYDNASNMIGLEKGLQALFKNINRYADYVPCTVHSLNLVGEKTVSTVPEVVDYFWHFAGAVCFLFWISTKMGDFKHTGQSRFFSKELKCN